MTKFTAVDEWRIGLGNCATSGKHPRHPLTDVHNNIIIFNTRNVSKPPGEPYTKRWPQSKASPDNKPAQDNPLASGSCTTFPPLSPPWRLSNGWRWSQFDKRTICNIASSRCSGQTWLLFYVTLVVVAVAAVCLLGFSGWCSMFDLECNLCHWVSIRQRPGHFYVGLFAVLHTFWNTLTYFGDGPRLDQRCWWSVRW